ncbi:hypothetical protein M5D96_000937 [Drosophila gunungcola]|uniref:Uncharacterized protein n=1 Tax=Drosophila gunungcola TaxID=103775 RepID=A0A9Q0BUV2_9MUSC|nr:hypothetical protein M5D96_000937 [Drosophila gunungcola]
MRNGKGALSTSSADTNDCGPRKCIAMLINACNSIYGPMPKVQ